MENDKLDSAIIKIVANHTREMNELDTTYKRLGVKHIALLNDYADLKILADNLKKENKKLRKLSEEQRNKFVEDLKKLPRENIVWDDRPGGKAHKEINIEFGKIASYVIHHRDLRILREKWEGFL